MDSGRAIEERKICRRGFPIVDSFWRFAWASAANVFFCGDRTDPNASVPVRNPQSSSFEKKRAYIKANPERAYGKAQSRGGDANTFWKVIFGSLFFGVSVSFGQCVFMEESK